MDGIVNTELITISKEKLINIIANVIDNLGKEQPKEVYSRLMTVNEVAEFTHYKKPTIYSFVHNGTIPYKKNRGKLFFKRSEIEEWMDKSR